MCVTCGCGHTASLMTEREHSGSVKDGPQSDLQSDLQSRAYVPDHTHKHPVDAKTIQIEKNILEKNDQYAEINRTWFQDNGVLVLNMLSSPGSGKTRLLTRTIQALKNKLSIAVIEGDQQTSNDAEKIKQTGVKALQINTGRGCHLDAHMIGHGLEKLKPKMDSLLFIENVGNLVCPALFDLGESKKVVILSVTEGEDKPIKYPDMFHAADLLLLNKIDLLPWLEFDLDLCLDYAHRINPNMKIIQVSATDGAGMQDWYNWIIRNRVLASSGSRVDSGSGAW